MNKLKIKPIFVQFSLYAFFLYWVDQLCNSFWFLKTFEIRRGDPNSAFTVFVFALIPAFFPVIRGILIDSLRLSKK